MTPFYNWFDLANMPPAQLATMDLARMNLICALGLPGTEKLDVEFCLRQIDILTERVRAATERALPSFHRDPGNYENSEAYFRILMMITVLQRDCGIRYNPAKIPHDAEFFAEDSFLFGIFQGGGGTCASLPVLYTAIGRRLGYPMKLVFTYNHRLCRWDSPSGERFNIEGSCLGLNTPPDQYYREGIFAAKPGWEEVAGSLLSLTPQRELAGFLKTRFEYWWNSYYFQNAVNCAAWSAELDGFQLSMYTLEFWVREWHRIIEKRSPFPFVVPIFEMFDNQRRFRLIPNRLEGTIVAVGVRDRVLWHFKETGDFAYPRFMTNPPREIIETCMKLRGELPWNFVDEFPAW